MRTQNRVMFTKCLHEYGGQQQNAFVLQSL